MMLSSTKPPLSKMKQSQQYSSRSNKNDGSSKTVSQGSVPKINSSKNLKSLSRKNSEKGNKSSRKSSQNSNKYMKNTGVKSDKYQAAKAKFQADEDIGMVLSLI